MVVGGSTYAKNSMLSSEAEMDYLYETKTYVTLEKNCASLFRGKVKENIC